MNRTLPTLFAAGVIAAGCTASASASTLTATVNEATSLNDLQQVAPGMYAGLFNALPTFDFTLLDDDGEPGRTCYHTLTRTLAQPDWVQQDGITCPSGDGTFSGDWAVTERTEIKFAVEPDDFGSSFAESAPVTMLVGPSVQWSFERDSVTKRLSLYTRVAANATEFRGRFTIRQGSRVVVDRALTSPATTLNIQVRRRTERPKRKFLEPGRPITMTFTPDSQRWIGITGVIPKPRYHASGDLSQLVL